MSFLTRKSARYPHTSSERAISWLIGSLVRIQARLDPQRASKRREAVPSRGRGAAAARRRGEPVWCDARARRHLTGRLVLELLQPADHLAGVAVGEGCGRVVGSAHDARASEALQFPRVVIHRVFGVSNTCLPVSKSATMALRHRDIVVLSRVGCRSAPTRPAQWPQRGQTRASRHSGHACVTKGPLLARCGQAFIGAPSSVP